MEMREFERLWRGGAVVLGLAALLVATSGAFAAQPEPWQLGFQASASPNKTEITKLHDLLLVIITLISAFVLALLLYVIVKFNSKANPEPTRTTHNTILEVAWTLIPALILVGMAVPSFKLLYYLDRAPEAKMTIKVVGHQWYWTYQYPDHGNFEFDSTVVSDKDLKPGQIRLLEVDRPLVVPAGIPIRVLVTGTDVMHSWFVPAIGVQIYAIAGRTNETWMQVTKEGTYRGQCNQICGINHGFMPVVVQAVSMPEFNRFVTAQRRRAGLDDAAPVSVAAAQAE
jgi:cytochrome c oxidase subunit II